MSSQNTIVAFPQAGFRQSEPAVAHPEPSRERPPAPNAPLTSDEAFDNLANRDITLKRSFSIEGVSAMAVSAMARKVTERRIKVTMQEIAIIAEGIRLERNPNRTIRHHRRIVCAIAEADRQRTSYQDFLADRFIDPDKIDTYALAADAYAPRRRGRQALGILAVGFLMFAAYERGQDSTALPSFGMASTEGTKPQADKKPSVNAAGSITVPEAANAQTPETTTTTASTTTTTAPKPRLSTFQRNLAKPLTIQLPAGATAELAAEMLAAATYEKKWNAATFRAYKGDLPADYPGGKVTVNDCQGEDVDLIRAGDTISGIAKDNDMSIQELTDLNEGNVMLARAGLCIRVGDGNKGVKEGGI